MATTRVDRHDRASACIAGRLRRSAAITGALAGLAATATLSLVGAGIGASLVAPLDSISPVEALDRPAILWLLLVNTAGMVLGGAFGAWLSGEDALDGSDERFRHAVQGMTTCAVAVIIAGMAAAVVSSPAAVAERTALLAAGREAFDSHPDRTSGQVPADRRLSGPAAIAALWSVVALGVGDAHRQ